MNPSTTSNIELPYDITALPIFAWTPSWVDWIVFVLLSFVLIASLEFFRRRRSSKTKLNLLTLAKADLLELKDFATFDRQAISRLNLALRRILSFCSSINAISMSPHEMKAALMGSDSEDLRQIAPLTNDLDALIYGNKRAQSDNPQVDYQMKQIISRTLSFLDTIPKLNGAKMKKQPKGVHPKEPLK